MVSKQVVNDLLGITTPQKPNPQTPKTPKEIEQRLPELGLTLVNSGYGQTDYMPSSQNFVVSVIGNQRLSLTLYQNNTTDAETIKTILNWALPTSGNEIYNILTKKQFTSQFITRDGKLLNYIMANIKLVLLFLINKNTLQVRVKGKATSLQN